MMTAEQIIQGALRKRGSIAILDAVQFAINVEIEEGCDFMAALLNVGPFLAALADYTEAGVFPPPSMNVTEQDQMNSISERSAE